MLPLAFSAASSALDALNSLTSSKSSSSKSHGARHAPPNPFDLSGSTTAAESTPFPGPSSGSQISPETMSALLDAQSQSSSGSTTRLSGVLKDLFSQIDTDGDGQLSKTEFEGALGAGRTNLAQADDVFGKMDKDGDGAVSLDEMMSALKVGGHHHRHHAANSEASSPGGSKSDSLLQALQGASTTSVSNSDGSTTTSLTYADGSKVTMTSPATTAATSSYNFIEKMIAREARAISNSAMPSLSISA
jgi:hypothetical protein